MVMLGTSPALGNTGPIAFNHTPVTTESLGAGSFAQGNTNMMPAFALGSYLLGTGLDLYGQHQGAKSMERTAQRQLAEQEAFNQERQALLQAELARRQASPMGLAQSAGATARLGGALRAVNPTARAGGKALGINAAGVDAARTSLLPALRVGAQRDAAAARTQRDRTAMTQLGGDLGGVDLRRREAASLYDAQDELAGMRGQTARLAGGLMRLGGQGGINYLMQQERPGLRG